MSCDINPKSQENMSTYSFEICSLKEVTAYLNQTALWECRNIKDHASNKNEKRKRKQREESCQTPAAMLVGAEQNTGRRELPAVKIRVERNQIFPIGSTDRRVESGGKCVCVLIKK